MDLRNIEYALRLAVRRVAWGATRPANHVHTEVWFDRMHATTSRALTLNVRVKPDKRLLHLGSKSRYIITPPEPVSVGAQIVLSDKELAYGHASPEVIVLQALQKSVLQVSVRLYEADPRIGSCDHRYEHLPLFDPPNGIDAMRRFPGCVLCGDITPDPGGAGYRAWGGGNVGWVHPTCLANVYP